MDINRLVSNMQDAAASALKAASEGVSQMNQAGGNFELARAKDVFSFHEAKSAASSQSEAILSPEAGFPDPFSFLNNMGLFDTSGPMDELLRVFSEIRNNLQNELTQLSTSLEGVLQNMPGQNSPEFGALTELQGAIGDLTGLYQQGSNQFFNQIGGTEIFRRPVDGGIPPKFLQEQFNSRIPSLQSSPYSVQEKQSYGQSFGPGSNLPAYGSRGQTIADGQWGLKFGEANFQGQGEWGSAYFRGENFIGARGRVFGDMDWNNRSMQVGVEAEIGARAHYEGGYRTPDAPVGVETGMAADAFAGARASGTAELSLNENAPRVAVGGEMFEGSRAGLDVGGGLGVDGNRLVGGHYGVEAWGGVGAKFNADLGLKDGNLRFDFSGGLALLIGAEVSFGFDLNFGDAFRSVKKLAENLVNELEKSAGSVAKELGKAAENTAKAVANTAGDAAKTVVNTAGDAAKTVANVAGGAAKAVGNFVSSIF